MTKLEKENLPDGVWDKLKNATFAGERVYCLDHEDDLHEALTVEGYDEAVKTAHSHHSWELSNCYWSSVLLKFADENTKATIEGFSTGNYPDPQVNVEHENQKFSWVEIV